ncbi:uncharacterized protein PAC_05408 [Phialocephala subalpina]|uniref:Carbohydrate kinase PfkB domain-containing protein n=1 Tax=Phialocephala subalpina TaxID=576137 RepID=A0A1L7WRX6_9HELO|nr:uncharacterized protein PAC_05408 [Phialocephala subalpina]
MATPPTKPSSTVFVVGSLNMDFIGIVKTHTARRKHQPFKKDLERPGGHGANQAVAVYRASHCRPESRDDTSDGRLRSTSGPLAPTDIIDFEVHVHMVGMVGDDWGDVIKKELQKNNVNTQGIEIAPKGVKTGFAHIHVDGEGVPEISNSEGANGHLTPDTIKSWSPAPAMVLVQLEIPIDTVRKVIEQANAQNIPIIFNPAPYNEKHNILRQDKKLFKVDHLIVNAICTDDILDLPELTEQEFQHYGRRSEMQKRYINACNEFHNLGAGCVVITLGSLGAIASYLEPKDTRGFRNPKIWIFGAKEGPNPLVDETGASDAFIGTYAVEILRQSRSASEKLDIGAAVELGIKAGGLAVANMGSMDSIPWRDEIYMPDRTFTAVSPFEFDEEA